ncbi:MAG: hypothetical protein AAF984_07430 [Verrucomicrobiota bacterium]
MMLVKNQLSLYLLGAFYVIMILPVGAQTKPPITAPPVVTPPHSSKWKIEISGKQKQDNPKENKQNYISVKNIEGVMGPKTGIVTLTYSSGRKETYYSTMSSQLIRSPQNAKNKFFRYTAADKKKGIPYYYAASRYFVTGFPGLCTMTEKDFTGILEHEELGSVALYQIEAVPRKINPNPTEQQLIDVYPQEFVYLPPDGPQVNVKAYFDIETGLPIRAIVDNLVYNFTIQKGNYKDPVLPQAAQEQLHKSVMLQRLKTALKNTSS